MHLPEPSDRKLLQLTTACQSGASGTAPRFSLHRCLASVNWLSDPTSPGAGQTGKKPAQAGWLFNDFNESSELSRQVPLPVRPSTILQQPLPICEQTFYELWAASFELG